MASITLRLTARKWATVDAVVDNALQAAAEDGEDTSIPANIRASGWAQVPWVGQERAWPPDSQVIEITLTAEEWDYSVEVLEGVFGQSDLSKDAVSAIRGQLGTA